jgi:hypothetical protein
MKKKNAILIPVCFAFSFFVFQFAKDIYHIGVKDGKANAHKSAIVVKKAK